MVNMHDHNRLSRTIRTFLWVAVLSVAAVGLGCGSGGKGNAKVSGTVKYKGNPLPSGTVTFFDEKKEIVGSTSIQDGSYAMEGVPTGKVTVSVTTPPAVKPNPKQQTKNMPGDPPLPVLPIPPRYGDAAKSGLSLDVKSGDQDFPIELN
jgi:hypothetical protein